MSIAGCNDCDCDFEPVASYHDIVIQFFQNNLFVTSIYEDAFMLWTIFTHHENENQALYMNFYLPSAAFY